MANEKLEIEIVLDDGSIKKGFATIKKQSKKTSEDVEKNFSKAFKSMALKFAGAFAIGAVVRKATNDLKEFSTALAEISTITQGLGIDQAKLNKQLVAASAQFGTTAAAQAKTFYQIVSAGITDVNRANQLLIDSNKLAIGGLTSTEQSVDVLTSVVNAYGQENITSTKAADILFATVKLGKVRVDELASSLGQILPSASALNVSFEDVSAAIAQLTTKGVSASEAITQLNGVFTAILKKQDVAKSLGPKVAEAFSLQALQAKGLTKFLKDLNEALGGSETKLVKLIGRAEGARAIMSLAGDEFEGMRRKVDALANSTGASDEAFQLINKTLEQKLNRAASTFSAILLNISLTTEGPLVSALDTVLVQLEQVLFAFNAFKDIPSFFKQLLQVMQVAFLEFLASIFDGLSNLPLIGSVFAQAGEAMRMEIGVVLDAVAADLAIADQEIADAISLEQTGKKLKEEGDKIVANLRFGFVGQVKTTFADLAKVTKTALVAGLGRSFQAFGAALSRGENAFEAFGKGLVGTMGDIAIQLGTLLIAASFAIDGLKTSLLTLNGPAAFAAGAALLAVGGALKAFANEGPGGATAGGGTTAGGDGTESGTDIEVPELQEQKTEVNVNLQGNLVDPQGAALAIAELLTDEGRNIGLQVS